MRVLIAPMCWACALTCSLFLTSPQVPFSAELLGNTCMPFALVVNPMALPDPTDDQLKVSCYKWEGRLGWAGRGWWPMEPGLLGTASQESAPWGKVVGVSPC